ncbi:MAG: putative lipid II flippase FtsW [Oscillospiraceae bacterium]|nr:putative lipid II flippase FtsW [Oscillospiraceae bacterium]
MSTRDMSGRPLRRPPVSGSVRPAPAQPMPAPRPAAGRSGRMRPVGASRRKMPWPAMFTKDPGPLSGGLLANLVVLLVFGLIVLFSASYAIAYYKFGDSYHYIRSQAIYAVVGFAAMLIISRVNYRWLLRFAWPLYWVTLVLLVAVLFMPPINDVHRWINIKGLPTVQVGEIAKFSIVLLLATLFEQNRSRMHNFRQGILLPGVLLLPILVLLRLEPHNSAMILMCCITATMMFVGGTNLMWFGVGGGAAAGGIALLLITSKGYVQERLSGWLDPFSDVLDSTMQTAQGLYTIGSGGWFGVGLGNSTQKHMWLSEAQNDFIFAILGEELGFVGALLCIALFALLIAQGIYVAVNAPDRAGCLLVVGVMAQIGFQFFFNVAVVTNTIPNTGISLPFFSSGGTSLLLLLGEMGVVFSVSRAANKARAERKARQAEEKARQETHVFRANKT